jgi:sugar/nucleoside kinase (ribokinase family)
MSRKLFDLVSLGHIREQMVQMGDKTGENGLWGASAFSAMAAARLGLKSGLVGCISTETPKPLLEPLRQAGVNIQGIMMPGAIHEDNVPVGGRRMVKAAAIEVTDIPQDYINCRMVYICPLDNDVRVEDFEGLCRIGQQSAVDLSGFVGKGLARPYKKDTAAEEAAGLCSYFDIVRINEEDGRSIFGGKGSHPWAGYLLEQGPEAILINMEDGSACVYSPEHSWHVPAWSRSVRHIMMTNQAFMAGFVCEYLRNKDMLRATVFGLATAALVGDKNTAIPENLPTREQVHRYIPDDYTNSVISIT